MKIFTTITFVALVSRVTASPLHVLAKVKEKEDKDKSKENEIYEMWII